MNLRELYLNSNRCTNGDFVNEAHLNNLENYLIKCSYEDDTIEVIESTNEMRIKELEAKQEELRKIFTFCMTSLYSSLGQPQSTENPQSVDVEN